MDQKGDELKIILNGPAGETTFEGRLAKDGPSAGMFLGSYNFRGEPLPAHLEKTTNTNVAPLTQNPLVDKCVAAINEPDPRKRINRLEEALNETTARRAANCRTARCWRRPRRPVWTPRRSAT